MPSGADGRAGSDPFALEVARSSGGILGTSIAFLTGVEDTITTSGFAAGGSAFVSSVGIVVTGVALFISFNDAVSADRSSSVGPGDLSSVQWVDVTSIITDGSLEDGQLFGRDGGWLGEDVPGDSLSARRRSQRTSVLNSWRVGKLGEENGGVECSGTSSATSASVVSAGGGATSDRGI